MKIVPSLNLNKHYRDILNYSLVGALNVQLTKDNTNLTAEHGIEINNVIDECISNYIGEQGYEIVSCISCNNELIIFAKEKEDGECYIFRYSIDKDDNENCKLAVRTFGYNGGKIKGTFTYNVDNHLIIAFTEYDGDVYSPIKVIDLDSEYTDGTIYGYKYPLIPEVNIPNIKKVAYINGNSYKGLYYIFIRYKIDDYSYTQWYSIGYPIYVDKYINKNIIDYYISNYRGNEADNLVNYSNNALPVRLYYDEIISDDKDICDITFSFILQNIDVRYKNYQIGYIISKHDFTKCFISKDYDIKTNIIEFNSNIVTTENSVEELITTYNNYYNVKNITNNNNSLVIANYNEYNYKVDNRELINIVKNIKARVVIDSTKDIGNPPQASAPVTNAFNISIGHITKKIIGDKCYITDFISVRNPIYIRFFYQSNIGDDDDNKIIRVTPFIKYDINSNELYINLNKTINSNSTAYYLNYDKNKIIPISKTISTFDDYTYTNFNNTNLQFMFVWYFELYSSPKDTDIIFSSRKINNGYSYQNIEIKALGSNEFANNDNFSTIDNNYVDLFNKSTLLPNEIYDFYIHFVDKYGAFTNGYKLTPDNYMFNNTEEKPKVILYPIRNDLYVFNLDEYVVQNNELNIYAGSYNSDEQFTGVRKVTEYNLVNGYYAVDETSVIDNNDINILKQNLSWLNNNKYVNYKWKDVLVSKIAFNYANNNGEIFTKTPFVDGINDTLKLFIEDIVIPDNYIGYFISYASIERNTLQANLYVNAPDRTGSNKEYNVFSDSFDINDKIKIDFDYIIYNNTNKIDLTDDLYDKVNSSFAKIPIETNTINCDNFITKSILAKQIKFADDIGENNNGQTTKLNLTLYNDGNNVSDSDVFSTCILCKINPNVYTSNNRTLHKLSDIHYFKGNLLIQNGYHGRITSNNVMSYLKIDYNDANNIIENSNTGQTYYGSAALGIKADIYNTFMVAFHSNIVDTYFHESKQINNFPNEIKYIITISKDTETNTKYKKGRFVTPMNTKDLYINKFHNIIELDPNTYINNKDNDAIINRFDKTIRVSNVIQDESRIIGWRQFNVDKYKNINYNKGNITNIVSSGTMFIIHTEYSLFIIDTSNYLNAVNKTVQLDNKTILDSYIKEVFTSNNLYGGLQDDLAYIIGSYGYIWFDNNSNTILEFSTNGIKKLDENIINWLSNNKPKIVRFVEDFERNRILIKFDNNNTLSYNYNTKTFISFHSYKFVQGYNTNTKTFLINDNKLINFNKDSQFINTFLDKIYPSYIHVCINTEYDIIKRLEHISYKVRIIPPVEITNYIYAGDYIRIYNDITDTKDIDISNDTNDKVLNNLPNFNYSNDKLNNIIRYNKPYYKAGVWNFSYIYNNNYVGFLTTAQKEALKDYMSQIIGNYFIIKFSFNTNKNKATDNFEFDSLDVNLNKL